MTDTHETRTDPSRLLEIERRVRGVWDRAFAAGQIPSNESVVGDPTELNVAVVVEALADAEAGCAGAASTPEQVTAHLDIRQLDDLVLQRLLDHEETGQEGSALWREQEARASAAVALFVTAVYGDAAR
ncbi:hypothetical protein ABZ234_08275 [Nocardiopsis sp. NPDC006198]|uniref:hypothetical protein n=1 Tax=Nocardiopsis sp. NPDC006198 TaxID=3154472 RepID=UPI0033B148BE